MLPRLLTLNNRILELGQEKKKQRKQHYEEKHMKEGAKEGVKEKKAMVAKEKRGMGEKKKEVKATKTKEVKVTKTKEVKATPKQVTPKQTTAHKQTIAHKQTTTTIPDTPKEFTSPESPPTKPEANPSGVVGVETAYSVRKNTTKPEDLEAFFKVNGEAQEDVGGWDD